MTDQNQSPSGGSRSSVFDLKTVLTVLLPAVAVLIAGIYKRIDATTLASLLVIAILLFLAIWGPMKKLRIQVPWFKFDFHRSVLPSKPFAINWPIQFLLTILVLGGAILLFQYLSIPSGSDPQFEITALNTFPGDRNIYEVTDQLIWNAGNLDEHGVAISYTIQVRPIYRGEDQFGEVVAIISGVAGQLAEPIPVWASFNNQSDVATFALSLSDVLEVTDLQLNSESPENVSGSEPLIQEAVLNIQIAEKANLDRPWSEAQITFRNSPWDFHAALVNREIENKEIERQLDFYIKNLGGEGDFTLRYRLVRLGNELSSEPHPMLNNVTDINNWNMPKKFIHLKQGESFQGTHSLTEQTPENLPKGRYLLEVYAVKKQPYVQFPDPSTIWDDLNTLKAPWLFARYPFYTQIFIETKGIELDPLIQAELDRLSEEQGVDLGIALGEPEEITSEWGIEGQRQWFESGVVYFYDDQVYVIYGPVYDYFMSSGRDKKAIFPVSKITHDPEAEIYSMEFEKVCENCGNSEILVSSRGSTWLEGWIRSAYYDRYGGYHGWLGVPIGNIIYYADSEIQLFRNGYISYYYPVTGVNENGDIVRNWGHEPTAYRYLSSHNGGDGILFEINAKEEWQDTGIAVNPGEYISIVQIGGAWTNGTEPPESFDANGNPNSPPADYRMLSSAQGGALIGKVGDEGNPFLIGRWYETTIEEEGTLYLAMNDSDHSDNDGIIVVQMIHTSDE